MINLTELKQKWSFLAGQKVFVACSGGVDSMVLLHLLYELKATVQVLHVNYHLRGEESNLDEQFVRDYCQKKALPFKSLSIDMQNYLEQHKGNLQEQARKIRYEWFHQFLAEPNSFLALGHHFDDQMETFYQHLARKSGILGMACMLEQNGALIRPLLNERKASIKQFAQETDLSWREDASNTSLKYTRNRIRNEFLPFLEKQIPNLATSIAVLIHEFQENYRTLELTIKPTLEKIQVEQFIQLTTWNDLSLEQQLLIIRFFGFSASHLGTIQKLRLAQKGRMVVSPTYRIVREAEGFSIERINNETFTIPTLQIEKSTTLPAYFSKNEIYLDETKLKGALSIRPWQIGDRISPLGMKGSKLISDIITESKIPNSQRKTICVVHDEQAIHWCVGLKIGRKAVADKNCVNLLKINILARH